MLCAMIIIPNKEGEQWPHINWRLLSLLAYIKFCLKHYNIVFSCRLINSIEVGNDVACAT